MYVKKFTGPTVSEALRTARRELGEETLLLGTRSTSSARGVATEITVALARPEPSSSAEPARPRPARRPAPPPPPVERGREVAAHDDRFQDLEARFDLLSRRIRDLQIEMEPKPATADAPFRTPAVVEIAAMLVESGLGWDLSNRAAESVLAKGSFSVEETFLDALARELSLYVPARRQPPVGKPGIVVLVGPAGSGKTTTAAKLAARAAVAEGKDVALVTADDYRIGAVEQFREYALVLGVPLEAVRDARELGAVLARQRERDLIVVDTPGVPRAQGEQFLHLGRLLEAAPGAVLRLVVSATTRARDIVLAVSRFRVLGPIEIVFTKLDETSFYGELLSSAATTACPVAAIATGRAIPDDYEEISPERLAEIVVRSAWPSRGES